jgi:CheY-like chemotaxis protein
MSQHLLYVEDEHIVAMVVTMALEDAGFEVRHEDNGRSAVEVLQAKPDDYDALVTDVRLPEMNGWSVARQARAISPGIPVVYVTGDSAGHWDREGVPNSVMLQKPFVNSDLIAALRALIN